MAPSQPDPESPQRARIASPGVLAPGTRIDRFQVQHLLGQGGMGAVYLAWDPVLERKVALKAIRLVGDGRHANLERFRREAMALAQLNHPQVCQVHDWVEARGSAYIAMEFIEGDTLAALAASMDLPQKLRTLRAIAEALAAAHAKGIVHRDLKPTNVMVDAQGQVKVLDFGLARLADPLAAHGDDSTDDRPPLPGLTDGPFEGLTQQVPNPASMEPTFAGSSPGSLSSPDPADMTEAGQFMGSPSYASPEQMRGRKVGPSSDIYSLGVVAWELLFGSQPFPGEGRARMAAAIQGDLQPFPYRLPWRLGALLRSMLQRKPGKRPTSAEVAEALTRHLDRAPLLWWVGGAATLVGALGLGYLLFGRSIIADLVKERPPRLAVLPLHNDTGDGNLEALVSVGMTELLSAALQGAPSLTVVEPEAVSRVIANLHLSAAEARQPTGEARIAQALGAKLFLRGGVKGEPGSPVLVLSYELLDAEGKTRATGTATAPRQTPFVPYPLVDPAVHDLLRKVDPLRSSGSLNAPIPPEVFAIYAKGKALFLKGDFKGSEAFLAEASLKAPAFSGAVSAYAACLRRLGREQAPLVANWSLMSARATGDRWAECRALGLKAYLARDQGHLEEAQQLREASLALALAIGDRDGETIAYNHLGIIAGDRGRDQEARSFYEKSLRLSEQTGDQYYQSLAQNNLANLALKQGDLARAEALYRTNLDLQRGLHNRWGEGLALNNLGIVALMAQDLPRAEAMLTQALQAREAVGDRAGQTTCLRNLGILALMKGQLVQAETYQGRSLVLAQQAGLRTVEAECQFYGAELARLQQRFPQARAGYQKVLELLPEGVTPGVRGNAMAGLAECQLRMPRPDLADIGRRLLALGPEVLESPYLHRAKAWLAFKSGQPTAALSELDQALADPRRQAPELRRELEATRAIFLAGSSRR